MLLNNSKREFKSHSRWDFFVLLIISILIFNPTVVAQDTDKGSISGTVVDAETGEPLQNVNIILAGIGIGTTTNEKGEYFLDNIPAGNQTVEFSYVGYIIYKFTRQFYNGVAISAAVELIPHHVRFEEIEVVGETTPRDIRRRGAESDLVTRTQIEGSGVGTFSELIRSLIPRATVRENGPDLYISLMRATSLVRRYHGDNNPLIIIDGFRYGTSPHGLASIISVDEIDKLEVLRGSAALMYGTEGKHGVIIIDTKPKTQMGGDIFSTWKILGGLTLGILMFLLL